MLGTAFTRPGGGLVENTRRSAERLEEYVCPRRSPRPRRDPVITTSVCPRGPQVQLARTRPAASVRYLAAAGKAHVAESGRLVGGAGRRGARGRIGSAAAASASSMTSLAPPARLARRGVARREHEHGVAAVEARGGTRAPTKAPGPAPRRRIEARSRPRRAGPSSCRDAARGSPVKIDARASLRDLHDRVLDEDASGPAGRWRASRAWLHAPPGPPSGRCQQERASARAARSSRLVSMVFDYGWNGPGSPPGREMRRRTAGASGARRTDDARLRISSMRSNSPGG
jgi:hypothetical protein